MNNSTTVSIFWFYFCIFFLLFYAHTNRDRIDKLEAELKAHIIVENNMGVD